MSKNTKIIAIIGGVLILALVLFSALTEGGCGATIDVWKGMLGCSSKEAASEGGASSRNTVQKEEGKTEEKADEADEPEAEEPAKKEEPAEEEVKEEAEEGADD